MGDCSFGCSGHICCRRAAVYLSAYTAQRVAFIPSTASPSTCPSSSRPAAASDECLRRRRPSSPRPQAHTRGRRGKKGPLPKSILKRRWECKASPTSSKRKGGEADEREEASRGRMKATALWPGLAWLGVETGTGEQEGRGSWVLEAYRRDGKRTLSDGGPSSLSLLHFSQHFRRSQRYERGGGRTPSASNASPRLRSAVYESEAVGEEEEDVVHNAVVPPQRARLRLRLNKRGEVL